MADRRRAPAMRGSRYACLAVICLCSLLSAPARCAQDSSAAAQRSLPELQQVGSLPHLPAVNLNSFAGSGMQSTVDALPAVAPTTAVQQYAEAAQAAAAGLRAEAAPAQELAQVVAADSAARQGQSVQPPAPGPRAGFISNLISTGRGDPASASAQDPPQLPQMPQPKPGAPSAPAPAPVAEATTSLNARPTDALHGADAASFQAVQQPQQLQLPEKPKTELVSNSDDSQTVIIKMPRVAEPVTNLQSQLPNPGSQPEPPSNPQPTTQHRRRLAQTGVPAPAPGPEAMAPVHGLPALPAVPSLGLPDMPQIALPASAEGLVTPFPAPRPQANWMQGPAAAEAYQAAQPYSAFYKLLPMLSGTGVGRKLQQGQPQQPAAGQGQVQDFHKDPSALQKKELQSAPVVLHPDFTLDQNSKILTLNQGQATIFGQKYTLPALPFKLPATPALNSLQSLYPNMNLGDVPQGLASAPAPAAEIAAAIAAEEAPTPQEQAVSNPVTNVLSALLTGRRLQQQPQQPQAQQPAAGQGQVQDFHKDPSALQKKELQSAPVVLHPDFTLDQNSKILTLNQGQATIFGQKYTLPALPFKLPATPALNSLQSLYPNMNLGDVPQGLASAPAPAAEIAAAIAAEEAPTPQEQAVSNPVTNVLSALLTGRRLQQQQPQQAQAQQPAAGQGQVQDFHKDPSALQKKELQSAPVVLHPDFTLDQNSKILTLNQGQATIFGQKYTLPALPFKLPATPALNSLQSLYPNMNLGDVPQGMASAPAPAAEIAAAIAAEEAPTPQEQAVSNPVTNVLSALLTGRRLQQQQAQPQQPQAQIQANDPSKPAQPFGYRNPKPLIQVEPKLLVDQKNRKAFATGGDILLANGQKIPLPGGFALPTTGLWSGLLDIPEGSKVEGPVPAPDLAPSVPLAHAAAMAPAPTAPINPLNPVSLLVNALTTIGDAAQARANAAPATASGRKLAQLPANDPSKPAQPFGYRNPKPLIQVEPKMLIDQKNRKAWATGGDILLANGQKIPLPGGFALPTTGLWSNLLDIPEGAKVEGPIPGPDLAPSRPMAHMAPAMAPAPAVPDNPLSFLVQGIEKIGDRLQAQANAKEGAGRRLQGQEAVQGLTLSLALLGDTRETFGPKQDAFVKELEQGLGLQAGAVQVVRTQMQKARYAEDVLRLGRHLMAEAQTKEQGDLVVVFTVDTASPEATLAALSGLVGSSGQLTSALQSKAGVHLVPESLREVPPASDA